MSILDTIDGALADYEASGDAMRWVPEEKRQAAPRPLRLPAGISLDGSTWTAVTYDQTPLVVPRITIDFSQFEAAMRRVGEQLAELMRPFTELCKSMVPIAKALNEDRAARVSAMHREYRRRSKARGRRRR